MDWVASVTSSLVWNSTENRRQSFRTLSFVCWLTQLKFNQRNWPQWDKSQKEQRRTSRMERNRIGSQWPGKDNAIPKAQFVVYHIRFWCVLVIIVLVEYFDPQYYSQNIGNCLGCSEKQENYCMETKPANHLADFTYLNETIPTRKKSWLQNWQL